MSDRFKYLWSVAFLPLWASTLTLSLVGERSPWWGAVAVFFIVINVVRLVSYAPPKERCCDHDLIDGRCSMSYNEHPS